jgi:hypothetical protein
MNPKKTVDIEPLPEEAKNTDLKKKTKKESLEDILSAIKEKEAVVKPFDGKKLKQQKPTVFIDENGEVQTKEKTTSPENKNKALVPDELSCNNKVLKMAEYFAHPFKYQIMRFFAGMFFTLGMFFGAVIFFTALYLLKDIPAVQETLLKFIYLIKNFL